MVSKTLDISTGNYRVNGCAVPGTFDDVPDDILDAACYEWHTVTDTYAYATLVESEWASLGFSTSIEALEDNAANDD